MDISYVAKKVHPGKEMDDDDSKSSLGSRKNMKRDYLNKYFSNVLMFWICFHAHEVILMYWSFPCHCRHQAMEKGTREFQGVD